MSDSGSDEGYGPPLPPTHTTVKRAAKDDEGDEDDHLFIPALPPHMRKASKGHNDQQESSDSGSEDESEEYCPALPPHLMHGGSKKPTQTPQRRAIVGPMLPQGFAPPTEDSPDERDSSEEVEEEEEEEEEGGSVIGPLPPIAKVNPNEYRALEFEERARKMRDKLEGRNVDTNKPLVRESWMTELPEDKPNFCGLGARQFLRKTPAEKGDRSCWTDTPADRARKEKEGKQVQKEESTPEEEVTNRRDKELTEKVDEYNKTKRDKSLVDLHRKELKRKQSGEKPKERRPFSREEDLSINKFDDAQREAVMKKARQLNDRFSSGKAKFL